MTVEELYAKSVSHAVEYVHIVAARRGFDIHDLTVEIDDGREPGFYQEHTLTISIRDSQFRATAESIPHDWIEISTGFIDVRFSHRIVDLLSELEKKLVS